MPYTPTESMSFLRFLYNENKAKYVGVAGPYDAFSVHHNWVTPRYLAIDQGPISPMIENQKTQFLWNLFMNAPDVKAGLIKLGFHSTQKKKKKISFRATIYFVKAFNSIIVL